jgi:hypothetical protein
MKNESSISKAQSYIDIGEFWDTHDLADYWDQTEPAEFERRCPISCKEEGRIGRYTAKSMGAGEVAADILMQLERNSNY